MNTTATIHGHPTDENILVLRTPPDHAAEMGRFEPARYDRETFSYLIHVDHLDALRRFAKRIGMYLIDQRQAPPGERPLMPECKHCGQPARLADQPSSCPSCGKRWEPVFIDGKANEHSPLTKACVRCGHEQIRSFSYCSQCGEVMPPDDIKPARHILAARPNLHEPMALSGIVREVVDELDDGPTTAEWAQLVRLEIRPCKAPDRLPATRPTHDTPLPEEATH